MKRNIKSRPILIISIILLFSICIFTSCTVSCPRYNRQSELKNVKWQSTSNDYDINLEFVVLEFDGLFFGNISYDSEQKQIMLDWWNSQFNIFEIDTYGRPIEQYLSGGWYEIINDDEVELEFGTDYLFDGALKGKKIIVKASPIDPQDYGVRERSEVCWETEDKNLQLFTYQHTRRFSVGTYGGKNVVCYWQDGDKFEIYEVVDGVQQQEIVLAGKNECNVNSLKLICERQTLELSGRQIEMIEYPREIWYPPETIG